MLLFILELENKKHLAFDFLLKIFLNYWTIL